MLHYATQRNRKNIVLWELLAADIQSIESIRAVGTMLQQVRIASNTFFCELIIRIIFIIGLQK